MVEGIWILFLVVCVVYIGIARKFPNSWIVKGCGCVTILVALAICSAITLTLPMF